LETVDSRRVLALIRRQADGLANRLELLSEADWTRPTACPEWSIADLVAHLSSGIVVQRRAIENGLRGDTSPAYRDTAARAVWTESKQNLPPHKKASDLRDEMQGLLALFDGLTPADLDKAAWHAAGPQPIRWFLLQRLGETMIHRGDVLDGLHEAFDYPPDESELLVSSYLARLPRLLHRENCGGLRETIVFRGVGTLTILDGRADYRAAAEAAHPDLVLEARPSVLLRISTGRLHPMDAVKEQLLAVSGDAGLVANWHEMFRPL
jgi:uncharacterized protein (TIGR03083 family)